MSAGRTRQHFYDFLDYMAEKGLMAEATVAARKASASRVLGILNDDEAADVTTLDLDDVMRRFQNLEGRNFAPGSLRTYLSRTKSAVDDFERYLSNPLGFRPSAQSREPRAKLETKVANGAAPSAERKTPSIPTAAPMASNILPIPIRADTIVFVQGIPFDLTEAEAGKIANVIRAMATVK